MMNYMLKVMKIMNRIKSLSESPCTECDYLKQCDDAVDKNPQFACIKDNVFGNADFDRKDCGLWIALNCRYGDAIEK